MNVNNGKKSAIVIEVRANGYNRPFNMSDKTEIGPITKYIIETAKENGIFINERNVFFMGYRTIGIDSKYDYLEDIDNFFIFVARKTKEKEAKAQSEPSSETVMNMFRDWGISFEEQIKKSRGK